MAQTTPSTQIGQPEGTLRHAEVGFAIRNSQIIQFKEHPKGISPGLMTMKLRLDYCRSAPFISAYAPTMAASDDEKEAFYKLMNAVPFKHRLFILGDFNARVGRNFITWPRVLGHHFVGNENFNGTLLRQTCSHNELVIFNTLHPRSKHWHMLDYDIGTIHKTRVMRGTDCWSDHRLVRSTVVLKSVSS